MIINLVCNLVFSNICENGNGVFLTYIFPVFQAVEKKEEDLGDAKCTNSLETDITSVKAEKTSSVGPGGDVSQSQHATDCINETKPSVDDSSVTSTTPVAADEEKLTTLTNEDSVMDDIMADVDVVEEVVSQNCDEDQPSLSSSQQVGGKMCDSDDNNVNVKVTDTVNVTDKEPAK